MVVYPSFTLVVTVTSMMSHPSYALPHRYVAIYL